jgi:hypothetical protein
LTIAEARKGYVGGALVISVDTLVRFSGSGGWTGMIWFDCHGFVFMGVAVMYRL